MKFPSYPECAARDAFRSLPRLGMDEYVAFLAESMAGADPEKVARQKAIEEWITTPFSLHEIGHSQVETPTQSVGVL